MHQDPECGACPSAPFPHSVDAMEVNITTSFQENELVGTSVVAKLFDICMMKM